MQAQMSLCICSISLSCRWALLEDRKEQSQHEHNREDVESGLHIEIAYIHRKLFLISLK